MPKPSPPKIPGPQQRNDPLERRDKSAPPRRDEKPLFPNESDPPPEHPAPRAAPPPARRKKS